MLQLLVCFFIAELFFGFNGKWLILGGISIRHWLYAATLVCVVLKALYWLVKRFICAKQEGKGAGVFLAGELKSFSAFDWTFLVFLLLQMIWIVLIPLIENKTNPGALSTALQGGASIAIAILYFPAVYLLRIGKVEWKKYRIFVIGCCVALGFLHLFLYVAETIQWKTDHSVYFMERVMNVWSDLVGGLCSPSPVVMPMYSVRILYTFNIVMLFAFYFILGRSGKKYLLWSLLNLLAIFTAGTRALLVALVAGLVVYYVADCILYRWNKERWKTFLIHGIGILAFAVLADGVLFQGRNITRLAAGFSFSQEVIDSGEPQILSWASSEYSTANEIRGTTNSNSTRILEIKYYLGKFMEKPVMGHGFALQSELDRDMQGLVYLAKVGIVGISLCIVFFCVFLKRVLKMEKQQKGSALPALYVVVAILTDIQFQTMFGSLSIAMAVFLFLDMEYKGEALC